MFFQAAFCHCWKALKSKKIWLNTKLPERNFKKSILIHRRAGKKSRRQAEVIFLFLQLPLDFIVMMIGLRLVAALRNGFHRLPFHGDLKWHDKLRLVCSPLRQMPHPIESFQMAPFWYQKHRFSIGFGYNLNSTGLRQISICGCRVELRRDYSNPAESSYRHHLK